MKTSISIANGTNPTKSAGCFGWHSAARVMSLLLLFTLTTAVEAQDFTYTTNNGTITITGYTNSNSVVNLPETINGLRVTSIGDNAFADSKDLANITIPNSVASIGHDAFHFCTSLNNVTIPNSVTNIGANAFANCSGLTSATILSGAIGDSAFFVCNSLGSVTIGDGVTSIGPYAFYSCQSLTSVTIGNRVTSIGDKAFYECESLSSVNIPNSVTYIGTSAFQFCLRLIGVAIPNGVATIGDNAFYDCFRLTAISVDEFNSVYSSVGGILFNKDQTTVIQYPGGKSGAYTIPNTVTSIGDSAFYHCGGLTRLTIPNSVTNIGDNAFSSCYSLTNVTIPNSVVSIGATAFAGCAVPSIFIPNSVTAIGDQAFRGGESTTINVDPLNPVYSSMAGVLFDKTQTTLIQCPGGKVGTYAIPNTVTRIGGGAFYACETLTSVMVPDSVTSMGNEAFNSCASLTGVAIGNNVASIEERVFFNCQSLASVTLPNSLAGIGVQSFLGCLKLSSITIPNSVTNIEREAFSNCSKLTNVSIGSNVIYIAGDAFASCSRLRSFTVDPLNSIYSSVDGALINKAQATLIQCPSAKTGTYTIPNSVTNIEENAFGGSSGLTSVTIPNSVTAIGNGAFGSCTNLKNVTIPDSVTSLGSLAFIDCIKLTAVYFQGDAPNVMPDPWSGPLDPFLRDGNLTVYYLAGKAGWSPTFFDHPTAYSVLPNPQVLSTGPNFGVQTNVFGFTISWATNISIVVEASTNLFNPVWSQVGTNTLSGGAFSFSDPLWTNYPSRFYRIRSR